MNAKLKKKPNFLTIVIDHPEWRGMRGLKARLERAAMQTLEYLPEPLQKAGRKASFTVLLTSNQAVKTLNHDFRGINKPTNVLSFPNHSKRELTILGAKKAPLYLGDIAMAHQYVVAEADKQHKLLINHVTHLMIHGFLHLFGYDHQSDGTASRMEKMEQNIMADLGLPDPYGSDKQ